MRLSYYDSDSNFGWIEDSPGSLTDSLDSLTEPAKSLPFEHLLVVVWHMRRLVLLSSHLLLEPGCASQAAAPCHPWSASASSDWHSSMHSRCWYCWSLSDAVRSINLLEVSLIFERSDPAGNLDNLHSNSHYALPSGLQSRLVQGLGHLQLPRQVCASISCTLDNAFR